MNKGDITALNVGEFAIAGQVKQTANRLMILYMAVDHKEDKCVMIILNVKRYRKI